MEDGAGDVLRRRLAAGCVPPEALLAEAARLTPRPALRAGLGGILPPREMRAEAASLQIEIEKTYTIKPTFIDKNQKKKPKTELEKEQVKYSKET